MVFWGLKTGVGLMNDFTRSETDLLLFAMSETDLLSARSIVAVGFLLIKL